MFVKGVVEALTFADFILTTSEYNKASLAEHMACAKLDPLPVHLVPLGHELSPSSAARVRNFKRRCRNTRHRLCALCRHHRGAEKPDLPVQYLEDDGEVRPVEYSQPGVRRSEGLVGSGLHGSACRPAIISAARIVVVHDVTDVELDLLYRKCMLTMFPSFVEGWGLPVGESLAHGKICLCSAAGGIPEVGRRVRGLYRPLQRSRRTRTAGAVSGRPRTAPQSRA